AAGLSLLLALLVQISRLAQPADAPRPGQGRRAILLEQFRELVNRQFRQHWPLELYAERLGISAAQLGRICREELGESAMGLINARLMREAQRQLAYTELEIKQIAHALGFRDTSYFSRYFRKQAGIKPSEFRAAFQSVAAAPAAGE
ncbi:MAG TPA: helix-turn-helix domain-containing protein, partial [Pseudomonas sp.]